MILCYTGASRFSGGTITRVMEAYERGDRAWLGALQALRDNNRNQLAVHFGRSGRRGLSETRTGGGT